MWISTTRPCGLRNVQAMAVDKTAEQAERGLMALGGAIIDALGTRTQTWLAGEVGIDGGHLNKIIKGLVPGLSLEMVMRIENALGLDRGDLLRAGGFVSASGVRDAIAADKALTAEQKRTLRNVYDLAAASSGRRRRA